MLMPNQQERATSPIGPQQVGGPAMGAGLAPWLRQSNLQLAPMQQQGPRLGEGQQAKLAQQAALANQIRQAPLPPPKPGSATIPGGDINAIGGGAGDDPGYGMTTDEWRTASGAAGGTAPNANDPYNFGPDYSAFYDRAHGAGSYDSEAKRYAALDASGGLGDYEKLYGEFPESDPAAMEAWFRRAGSGGAQTAGQQ
jgi:hypothetical protein